MPTFNNSSWKIYSRFDTLIPLTFSVVVKNFLWNYLIITVFILAKYTESSCYFLWLFSVQSLLSAYYTWLDHNIWPVICGLFVIFSRLICYISWLYSIWSSIIFNQVRSSLSADYIRSVCHIQISLSKFGCF